MSAAPPTTVKGVAKQDPFIQKVVLLCGTANAGFHSEQLDRVYASLEARRYPAALIN